MPYFLCVHGERLDEAELVAEAVRTHSQRLLFRVMRPGDDRLPRFGRSASTLGVRIPGRDRAMSTADLERTVEEHIAASSEQLADDLYDQVKAALQRGEDREQVYATLREYYESAKERGLRREHRAVGIVLSYLDGYSSPISAL